MSELDIITFGCRLNTFESEVMREHADDAGLIDAVIINTCAVTNEAVRQARQAIRMRQVFQFGHALVRLVPRFFQRFVRIGLSPHNRDGVVKVEHDEQP